MDTFNFFFSNVQWIFVLGLCYIGACQGSAEEYNLIRTLLANYSTDVRPVENVSHTLSVQISVALNQIIDLDERNQILTVKVWMRQNWNDAQLVWDPDKHSGIQDIKLRGNQIWRPDIILYSDLNQPDTEVEKAFVANIHYDGFIRWNFPLIIRSTCLVEVLYFPWDQQICRLKFGSWSYVGSELDVVTNHSNADTTSFIRNGEWILLEVPAVRHLLTYTPDDRPFPVSFPDVTFYVMIRRKPLYYVFNLILPCVFIEVTALLAFYLPPESGEKVNLGVTVLLALTVFLLLVADAMPPQSDSIPIMAQYFGAVIIILSASTSTTVVIVNLYHRGILGVRVPKIIRIVILEWLATFMCMRDIVRKQLGSDEEDMKQTRHLASVHSREKSKRHDGENNLLSESLVKGHPTLDSPGRTSPIDTRLLEGNTLNYIFNIMNDFHREFMDKSERSRCRCEWMMVAMVLDRFFFLIFIVINFVVTFVLLFILPHGGEELVPTDEGTLQSIP